MSICIKTGAVLAIPAFGGVAICDLHLTGRTVVANCNVTKGRRDYDAFMHYPDANGNTIRPATHEVSVHGINVGYLHKDKGIIVFPLQELKAYTPGDQRLIADAVAA